MGTQPVGDAEHLQRARPVTEIEWRIDHGQADTVHEGDEPGPTLRQEA